MDHAGEKIDSVRVDNESSHFAKAVSVALVGSPVIVEATYGWYWAADLLKEMGYEVHLANPHGNDWGHRRVKNDERDARDLADLLRLGRLAEAWIAPPKTRELREMIRYRIKLSNVRTGLKAQVHAVRADLMGRYSNPLPEILSLFRELDLTRENDHNEDVRSNPSDRS